MYSTSFLILKFKKKPNYLKDIQMKKDREHCRRMNNYNHKYYHSDRARREKIWKNKLDSAPTS